MKYSPPRYLFRRHTVLKQVKKGDSFLEVGAGNLMLSKDLSKYYKKGTCLDFAPKVKTIYKELPPKFKRKLKVIVGDFFTLDIKQDYDCIVSCEVMEHIEDDHRFVDRIHSLLKKDGRVIISVPAKEKYWTVHDEVVGHVRRYEKDRLYKLFDKKRFKDVQILSYGFPFINLFWVFRRLHGKSQVKKKQNWTQEEQTKDSGVGELSKVFDAMAFIFNKYVFYLPNLFASMFNHRDLSEGYVIVATKK